MVDYLQLVRCPGMENRTQEIAEISRSLKALGKELGCPVLALSRTYGYNVAHGYEALPGFGRCYHR